MPVRVQGPNGWETLGLGRSRGIFPEGASPTWDQWGSLGLTFTLQRDPSRPQPDIAAFTPIEWAPPGGGDEPAWGGFIIDTPASSEHAITVNCRGRAFELDDNPYDHLYVQASIGDWQDARSFPNADLDLFRVVYQVAADRITVPKGDVVPSQTWAGVALDVGQAEVKRISVDYEWLGGSDTADWGLYAVGGTDFDPTSAGATVMDSQVNAGGDFPVAKGVAGSTGTASGSFATPVKVVLLGMYFSRVTDSLAQASDTGVRFTGIRLYSDTAYESGGASVLKASQIIKYALTKAPTLDQDMSEIVDTSLPLRAFGGLGESRTAREDMERSNDYHRYLLRVTPRGRVQFRSRFDRATLETSTRRDGVDWVDATVNSGEDVYNKVVVAGQTGSGAPVRVERLSTDVGISNLLDRRGRTRSKTLEAQAPIDATIAQALADAWLLRFARTPLKGTLQVTGRGVKEAATGAGIHPGHLGTRVGELLLLSDLDDPDTGDRGRVAITIGVPSYDEGQDTATVAVDNTRDDLEALMKRLGLAQT